MIDLSPMRTVRVDQASRTATVGAGATLGDVDRTTQGYGLATPLGVNSTTGIAGLTLGGGFGWLSRRLGLTIDNLRSAEVVTAEGEIVRASAREHPDLFWGIRGGGGNFGIVTSFEFQLHPVGPEVLSGLVVHPLGAARGVLRFYRDFLPTTPEAFSCWFVLRLAPPLPVPRAGVARQADPRAGDVLVGRPRRGRARGGAAPRIREAAGRRGRAPSVRRLADGAGSAAHAGLPELLEVARLPGAERRADRRAAGVRRAAFPIRNSEIAYAQLGGAVSRVPSDATAYTHRDAQFVMNVHGRWTEPDKDQACIGWARDLFRAATPFATGGGYVNFMTEEEGDRVRAVYGSNYERLVELKNRYDPTNLFRMNQNIRPTGR